MQSLVHDKETDKHVAGEETGRSTDALISFLEIGEVREFKKSCGKRTAAQDCIESSASS